MACLLVAMLHASTATWAGVPLPNGDELARAAAVAQMDDNSPSQRINQLLASRQLSRTERFVLAGTHPGVVEQLEGPIQKLVTNYLFSLTGIDLHKVRQGRTLVRPERSLSPAEIVALDALCRHHEVDPDKLIGVRFGPKDGRIYELEITVQLKRKKVGTHSMELGWPSTPARDEQSRVLLTKLFGARPSRTGVGVGSLLPLVDGSFEAQLTDGWTVAQGTSFGHHTPAQQIQVDTKVALDGTQSLRFYATKRTRQFLRVQQRVPVDPGTRVRLRSQLKAESIQLEYQQRRSDYFMGLTFLDINGQALGQTFTTTGRMGTHPWELLQIEAEAPPAATDVEVVLSSSVSGTAWYDGIVLEIVR
jgi:hypothetical protein